MTSCLDKDDDDGDDRVIDMRYDWTHGESRAEHNNLTVIAPDGGVTTFETDNVGIKLKLGSGTYTLTACEVTPTVIATPTTHAIYVDNEGYAIDPDPFCSGETSITLACETAPVYLLPMYYQTRQLILQFKIIDEDLVPDLTINGVLEGITVARKSNEGFPPLDSNSRHSAIQNGKVQYHLEPLASRVSGFHLLAGERCLLGIDADVSQILHLKIDISGVVTEKDVDVTEALKVFHIYMVNEPFVIEFSMTALDEFTAEIIDWQWGSRSEIDAN